MFSWILWVVFSGAAIATENPAVQIPPENIKQGVMPGPGSAELLARKLVDAIPTSTDVRALFFPAQPFAALKDLKNAMEYYNDHLIPAFDKDVTRLRTRFKNKHMTFVGLTVGRCKWKAVGTEYNKIAYWSCYRNSIAVHDASGKKDVIPVKTMINWGSDWYVTHLGF